VEVPAGVVQPARGGCAWTPALLPLPPTASEGSVTAGAGSWLVGVADGLEVDDLTEGAVWHDGRLVAAGHAFGLDTRLWSTNAGGTAVGEVTGPDGHPHAIRHRDGRYEYLPETAGSSRASDVNARGEAVGLDGTTLVVWPAHGPARALAMPPGAAPYGHPALDDDGTVVARTGRVEGGPMRWQTYAWAASGTRTPLTTGDVRDVRQGRVVGASGPPGTALLATGWDLDSGRTRVYQGGTTVVAVNGAGVAVGAGSAGEPLLWAGPTPTALAAPPGYHPGEVTAVNDNEAGGSVSPVNDVGTVPVRWYCR
jgi:hypothetical protein